MESKMRIALGMSGGVDSATSAELLLRAGFDVVGVTGVFIDDESSKRAVHDAAEVCAQLGIPHKVADCVAGFEDAVIAPFVEDYAKGITPSPCVHCNALCKLPFLIRVADESGCQKVATGHYARIAEPRDGGRYTVMTALDVSKDQSYMLSQMTQEQLSRLVLPLGATTKAEVRIMADDLGLVVADKPESQDVCFIEGDYADFLSMRGVSDSPGNIVTEGGDIVGRHAGLFRYTIGQRKGIGISAAKPYYVIDKRIDANELVVGFRDGTFISNVVVKDLNWQAFERLCEPLECMVKLRYRGRLAACVIEPDICDDRVAIRLRSPQQTTAPGQFAVFYDGETVLGSGCIVTVS